MRPIDSSGVCWHRRLPPIKDSEKGEWERNRGWTLLGWPYSANDRQRTDRRWCPRMTDERRWLCAINRPCHCAVLERNVQLLSARAGTSLTGRPLGTRTLKFRCCRPETAKVTRLQHHRVSRRGSQIVLRDAKNNCLPEKMKSYRITQSPPTPGSCCFWRLPLQLERGRIRKRHLS